MDQLIPQDRNVPHCRTSLGVFLGGSSTYPNVLKARPTHTPPKYTHTNTSTNTNINTMKETICCLSQNAKRQSSHRVYHCKTGERDEVLPSVCLRPLSSLWYSLFARCDRSRGLQAHACSRDGLKAKEVSLIRHPAWTGSPKFAVPRTLTTYNCLLLINP